jgi:hypothetical protein
MMSAQSKNGQAENAHLDEELMRKYQTHTLHGEELQLADRHLRLCGGCRRSLLARMGSVRLPEELADLPEPLHLSYEQITTYLDGALTGAEKESADAHLFLCASCSRELADLKRLDSQLAAQEPVDLKAREPRVSLAARIARFFAVPGRIREFGVAFGAIVLGVLLFQAGHGTEQGSKTAARLIHLGANEHAGLNLGGIVLITAGLGYMLFSFIRKR